MADMINKPPHYNKGAVEVWDFITDQGMGYFDGNAIKYICRYRHKGNPVQDLDKAIAFLTKLRDIEKAKQPQIVIPDKIIPGQVFKAELAKPTPPAPRVVEQSPWGYKEVQPTPGVYGKDVFKSVVSEYDRS